MELYKCYACKKNDVIEWDRLCDPCGLILHKGFEQCNRNESMYKDMKRMGFSAGMLFNYLKEQCDPEPIPLNINRFGVIS